MISVTVVVVFSNLTGMAIRILWIVIHKMIEGIRLFLHVSESCGVFFCVVGKFPPWISDKVVFIVTGRMHRLCDWDLGVRRGDGATTPFFR